MHLNPHDASEHGPDVIAYHLDDVGHLPRQECRQSGLEPLEAHTLEDPVPEPPPSSEPAAGPVALERAAAGWTRRGYRVTYRDAYLIQLLRRDRPGRRSLPFLGLALLALAGAGAALVVGLRRRPWHVVTLVIGPEQRILTHQQRAPHPPAP